MLVVGGVPGRPFQGSPWEAWLEAAPFLDAGEPERAVEILERALARYPGNPNVLYNLACVEALAGRTDAALTHLADAVERDPRTREWAQTDSDFDGLGRGVRLQRRPCDQLRLARGLERRSRRPERGAWRVPGDRAELGSPKETVIAGVRRPLRHEVPKRRL